ncbi:MAG: hydroxyethylthiazole kinase [Bacillota bacterium]|nr:hydroxyethylthiazole kinase [Bacillota bacterium]
MFIETMKNVREQCPLTHCITNYVTVNGCANALLAVGGSPIMADDIDEVAEITAISRALVINIGTLNARTVKSMVKAGITANEKGIPVVLDPVGAGASTLRNQAVAELMEKVQFTVIRGNISEVKNVYDGSGKAHGVDVDMADVNAVPEELAAFAKGLSRRTGAVIAITGKVDVVADSERVALISNGTPRLSSITGSGCMLSAIIGTYVGGNSDNVWEAVVAATSLMGLSGEKAAARADEKGLGFGSFNVYLMDALSQITPEELKEGMKVEII